MTEIGHLELQGVTKRYRVDDREFQALQDINLNVRPGEFVSVVGSSGCGKTTLLRLVVGLDTDYEGDILLDGERIVGTNLKRGMVFQDPRLLPWLTLTQNVALALENVAWSAQEKRRAVHEHIELVGLTGFENAYPHQLSGGMAQRAAIARGLVRKPEILLLDEPLGALDALTRIRLQDELLHIWESQKVTMILVTHDVDEAVYLSDKVVVMQAKPGRVVQEIAIDRPHPRDRGDAEFGAARRKILEQMGALMRRDDSVPAPSGAPRRPHAIA